MFEGLFRKKEERAPEEKLPTDAANDPEHNGIIDGVDITDPMAGGVEVTAADVAGTHHDAGPDASYGVAELTKEKDKEGHDVLMTGRDEANFARENREG